MKQAIVFLTLLLCGCATTEVYNPIASANKGVFMLNESSFSQLRPGMKQDEVHKIMGEAIVIGYAYQKPVSDEKELSQAQASDYNPVTIKNPYKIEELKTSKGVYVVEYYVQRVQQPDGIVSDDELVPLYFHDGILSGLGKDFHIPS